VLSNPTTEEPNVTKTAPALTTDAARYFDRLAERQLELAARSPHPQAVAAHCAIADQLMALRAEAEAQPA
jgi:hypothetical protein